MTTSTTEQSVKADDGAPVNLDQVMDAVFAEAPSDPAPKTEPAEPADEKSVETEPATEPESVESPKEPETDDKATATPKGPAEYTLTPEEEHLLRRNQATTDDLAFYRGLTVEQRNKALAPLRKAQADKDRFWSLPKEERARLSQDPQNQNGEPSAPDTTEATLRAAIELPRGELEDIAKTEGISAESLAKLTSKQAALIAAKLAPIVKELDANRQRGAQSEADAAIRSSRDELAKSYSQLKDDKAWSDIVNDPETVAIAEAKLRMNGGDRTKAIRDALTLSAKIRFSETNNTRRQRTAETRSAALKGTSEPTGSGRGSLNKKGPPKNLDEAMDRVFADVDD